MSRIRTIGEFNIGTAVALEEDCESWEVLPDGGTTRAPMLTVGTEVEIKSWPGTGNDTVDVDLVGGIDPARTRTRRISQSVRVVQRGTMRVVEHDVEAFVKSLSTPESTELYEAISERLALVPDGPELSISLTAEEVAAYGRSPLGMFGMSRALALGFDAAERAGRPFREARGITVDGPGLAARRFEVERTN